MTDETSILDEVQEESEQTERQELESYIEQLRARLEQRFNLWTALELQQLEEHLATNFEIDGAMKPIEAIESILVHDFSPQDAQDATGYYIHHPSGFGRMAKWLGTTDPSLGLSVSNERHAGCVQIENLQVTSNWWRNDSDAAHDAISPHISSPRVFAMAGHQMNGWWYMLPAFDHGGAYKYSGFAMTPEIPYNEDEKSAYQKNFNKYHFGGAALVGAHLQLYGNVVWNQDHTAHPRDWKSRVDLDALKYRIPTVANHPNWVAPAMMDYFNSVKFMRKYYRWALSKAHRIDNRQDAPVPGYKEVNSVYRRKHERTGAGSHPNFKLLG